MSKRSMRKLIEQKHELLTQILEIDKVVYDAKRQQKVLREKMHEIETEIVLLAYAEKTKETTA